MSEIELSIVMPCLNEADTITSCVTKAVATLRGLGVAGEVVVADNGSRDDSVALAQAAGARVVLVPQRNNPRLNGYGRGLMTGIAAARGRYVLMGDSDDSYDFRQAGRFLEELRKGFDLVQGCRMPSGGGSIMPGAMPWSHRHIGNPMFTWLVRRWFRAGISDVNCGMRAFRKDWFEAMDFRCPGMEFAAEMIIRAGLFKARISEVPITLHPDGRKTHAPHLKTFRDGWRILRLLVLYTPTWLFMVPGFFLMAAGVLGMALALPGARIAGIAFDAHTLLFSSAFILCGFQAVLYSLLAKTFAVNEGLAPPRDYLRWFFGFFYLERGLAIGAAALAAGAGLAGYALYSWAQVDFGPLDYGRIMRIAIPGALGVVLGFQVMFASCFASVLGMAKYSDREDVEAGPAAP